MERIRAFVALNLPLELLGELAEVQKALRASAKRADRQLSWVPAANMHITLKFLGDIPLEASYAIRDRLERELQGRESFALSVGGLGVFPDERRPRVLWAGVDESVAGAVAGADESSAEATENAAGEATENAAAEADPAIGPLSRLASDVERWLDELGFEPDRRGFHGHVTLGRFKRGSSGDSGAAANGGDAPFWQEVEVAPRETHTVELVLYKSELSRRGAEYTALARYPLAPPPKAPEEVLEDQGGDADDAEESGVAGEAAPDVADVEAGQTSVEQASVEQASVEQTSVEQTSVEQTTHNTSVADERDS
jgi:2'-5' RNA ligase